MELSKFIYLTIEMKYLARYNKNAVKFVAFKLYFTEINEI